MNYEKRYKKLYGNNPAKGSPDFGKWQELQKVSGLHVGPVDPVAAERLSGSKVETCKDCGIRPERKLDGVPFGGYDRPLCNTCVGLENKRIDKYVKIYGNVPAEQCPDMKTWMKQLVICTECGGLVSGDGVEKETGACFHCFMHV